MLVLLATVLAFFTYSDTRETEQKQLKFNEQVHLCQENIERVFSKSLEIIDSLKSYHDASGEVTR